MVRSPSAGQAHTGTGTPRHETAPEFPARTSRPRKLAAGAARQAADVRGDGPALAMAAKAQLTATGRSSGARPGITSRPDRGRGVGRDTARGPAADTGAPDDTGPGQTGTKRTKHGKLLMSATIPVRDVRAQERHGLPVY